MCLLGLLPHMDSARVKYLAEFSGRAVLVAFFGMVATTSVMSMVASVKNRTEGNVLEFASQLANLAFVLLLLCLILTRLMPQRSSEGWEPRVSALVGTLLPLLVLVLPQTDAGPAMRISGLIMIAIGWILSTYVLLWLGRSFSVTPQARRLVTSGPYNIVRHPLYLSEEIAFLGIVMLHLSPAAVAIAAVHWPFQLRRMVNEEKVLFETFPEYSQYAACTPRVVPRVFSGSNNV
jgi:protein-S-isoprenylcysteine O-methyltransferase Ste14